MVTRKLPQCYSIRIWYSLLFYKQSCLLIYIIIRTVHDAEFEVTQVVALEDGMYCLRISLHVTLFDELFCDFHCYTVHVVELLSYYTNHCTFIKFIKFYTLKH